jgi:hypothetical protein
MTIVKARGLVAVAGPGGETISLNPVAGNYANDHMHDRISSSRIIY